MIYKTKEFCSLTKKDRLSDMDLIEACDEIQRGLVDADLGGALYKKRVATEGKGKSGGYRTILVLSLVKSTFSCMPLLKINEPTSRKKSKWR